MESKKVTHPSEMDKKKDGNEYEEQMEQSDAILSYLAKHFHEIGRISLVKGEEGEVAVDAKRKKVRKERSA